MIDTGLSIALNELNTKVATTGEKIEGNSGEEGLSVQGEYIHDLPKKNSLNELKVMEIGFNAGHSALFFLYGNSNVRMVSFDIGVHKYIEIGKRYIDQLFPQRHNLILGNSLKTIPAYTNQHPSEKFDIILIDGDHSYEGALEDIKNCKALCKSNTILIMDDVVHNDEFQRSWSEGPTKAWNSAIADGMVKELESYILKSGRGFAVGQYL